MRQITASGRYPRFARMVADAVPIFDTAVGPTADMPTAGWASTGNFTSENPNTIAAFQRAMQKGTDLALSDRSPVEPLLEKFSGVAAERRGRTAREGRPGKITSRLRGIVHDNYPMFR